MFTYPYDNWVLEPGTLAFTIKKKMKGQLLLLLLLEIMRYCITFTVESLEFMVARFFMDFVNTLHPQMNVLNEFQNKAFEIVKVSNKLSPANCKMMTINKTWLSEFMSFQSRCEVELLVWNAIIVKMLIYKYCDWLICMFRILQNHWIMFLRKWQLI